MYFIRSGRWNVPVMWLLFGWLYPCFRWMLSLVGGFGLSYLLSSLLFDNTARMATSLFCISDSVFLYKFFRIRNALK